MSFLFKRNKYSELLFSVKIALTIFVFIAFSLVFSSYAISYKEQYYKLFHVQYQQYPDDVMENIYWLERAVAADFANPQYALAKIANEEDWEKYRYLFMMHVNLKLIEQHMRLGRTWDKQIGYFYDAPWQEEYLRDLETAASCYRTGLYYWREAKLWAEKANQNEFRFLYLTDIQNWEDEAYRIDTGDLDYEKILTRELTRLQEVKDYFLAMDDETY